MIVQKSVVKIQTVMLGVEIGNKNIFKKPKNAVTDI